jgi:hypothetical protein
MKNIIAWEKWDADLIEQEIAEQLQIDEDDEELASEAMAMMKKIPKLVSTPVGIFQLHDKANPIKQLDCWTGHTNFDITKGIQQKIEGVRGIELLMVLSRYRFFVGVGKLFDFKSVRCKLEKSVCHNPETKKNSIDADVNTEVKDADVNTEVKDAIDLIQDIISSDKHWAIYVTPDGEIDYVSTDEEDDEKYLATLLVYEESKEQIGGFILQSDQF